MKLTQIRVDGYKNLIDCNVNLGDFNVLVGPNNSGKSNLLEALQMLGGLCFGSDRFRKGIFEGVSPPNRLSSWICHLPKHKNKPLTIGIALDLKANNMKWSVDYEVKIKSSGKKKGGFIEETLKAKKPSTTGRATAYISRKNNKFKIMGRKERPIASEQCSLGVVQSIYPDLKGLPSELGHFIMGINRTAWADVFAMWPDGLRRMIDEEEPIMGLRVTHFNPLFEIDHIKERASDYRLFRDAVCNILDLEEFDFIAKTLRPSKKRAGEDQPKKRVRYCTVTRYGCGAGDLKEFSDGTFCVVGLMAALFSKDREGPIFCVEDIENCLHPSGVKKFVEFLQERANRWPVLITTHSPYVLNEVNPSDVVMAVPDKKTGAVHFEKIEDRRTINAILNNRYMSFGDLLPNNFVDFIGSK